jgi:hypothetical protein
MKPFCHHQSCNEGTLCVTTEGATSRENTFNMMTRWKPSCTASVSANTKFLISLCGTRNKCCIAGTDVSVPLAVIWRNNSFACYLWFSYVYIVTYSLKAGIVEPASFTRQRISVYPTTQLGERISVATELLSAVFTLPSATYLLKRTQRDRIRQIETQSQENSGTQRIPEYRTLQKTSREYLTEKSVQGIRQFYNRLCAMELL